MTGFCDTSTEPRFIEIFLLADPMWALDYSILGDGNSSLLLLLSFLEGDLRLIADGLLLTFLL